MNDFDTLFNTLYRRAIGFDKLNQFSKPMTSFPPYDIVRVNDSTTEIHVAAAGYAPEDIRVFERDGVLHIESDGGGDEKSDSMIYKGIAKRSFRLTFALGNGTNVSEAACTNGMVVVRVQRKVDADRMIELKPSLTALTDQSKSDNVLELETGT